MLSSLRGRLRQAFFLYGRPAQSGRPLPSRWLRLATALASVAASAAPLSASGATQVPASTPQTYANALRQALAPADVVAHGTVFGQPLVTADNAVAPLLSRTPEVIATLVEQVAAAEHEILLQTYEWEDDDEAAAAVLGALRRRARLACAGVGAAPLSIRIVTSRAWPSENRLSQAALHQFVAKQGATGCPQDRVHADWATYRSSPMAILHSKTAIFDGVRALVMTGNLYTHGGLVYDSVNMGVLLQGPVVAGLRADWLGARALATLEVGSSVVDEGHSGNDNVNVNEGDAANSEGSTTDSSTAPAEEQPPGVGVAAILSRPSNWTYWSGGERNPQAQGLVALIDAATDAIDILNPSLSVDRLQEALVRAIVERGVRVRAVVSLQMNRSREHYFFGGDNAEQAYKLYARLLQRGGVAAADKLDVRFASLDGLHPSPADGPGNVHAKVVSFDQTCLLVGSTNWNWLSWNNGRELSVALVAPEVADKFSQTLFFDIFRRAIVFDGAYLPRNMQRDDDAAYAYLRRRR